MSKFHPFSGSLGKPASVPPPHSLHQVPSPARDAQCLHSGPPTSGAWAQGGGQGHAGHGRDAEMCHILGSALWASGDRQWLGGASVPGSVLFPSQATPSTLVQTEVPAPEPLAASLWMGTSLLTRPHHISLGGNQGSKKVGGRWQHWPELLARPSCVKGGQQAGPSDSESSPCPQTIREDTAWAQGPGEGLGNQGLHPSSSDQPSLGLSFLVVRGGVEPALTLTLARPSFPDPALPTTPGPTLQAHEPQACRYGKCLRKEP